MLQEKRKKVSETSFDIDMNDDVFGLTYRWVEEFSRKLIERKYDIVINKEKEVL